MNWNQQHPRRFSSPARTQFVDWAQRVGLLASLPLAIWLSSGWAGVIAHWNPGRAVLRGVDCVIGALRRLWSALAVEAMLASFAAAIFAREPIAVPVVRSWQTGRRLRSWR